MIKFTCCLALTASLAMASKDDSGYNALQAMLKDNGAGGLAQVTPYKAPAEPVDEHWKNFQLLDMESYENEIMKDDGNAWVVAFVAPRCGSCHDLAAEWDNIKEHSSPDHKVKFGYVNTSTKAGKEILRSYTGDVNIQYTPSILVYGADKAKPQMYEGDYDSTENINSYVCDYCDNNGFGHGHAEKDVSYEIDAPASIQDFGGYNNEHEQAFNFEEPLPFEAPLDAQPDVGSYVEEGLTGLNSGFGNIGKGLDVNALNSGYDNSHFDFGGNTSGLDANYGDQNANYGDQNANYGGIDSSALNSGYDSGYDGQYDNFDFAGSNQFSAPVVSSFEAEVPVHQQPQYSSPEAFPAFAQYNNEAPKEEILYKAPEVQQAAYVEEVAAPQVHYGAEQQYGYNGQQTQQLYDNKNNDYGLGHQGLQRGYDGDRGYGAPQRGYAGPQHQSYGAPQHQGYGAPQRQAYREPERQAYREPERQSYREPKRQAYREPERQSYRAPQLQRYGAPERRSYEAQADYSRRSPNTYSRQNGSFGYGRQQNSGYGRYNEPQNQGYNRQRYSAPQRQSYGAYREPERQAYREPERQSYREPERQSYRAPQLERYGAPERRSYGGSQFQGYGAAPERQGYGGPARGGYSAPQRQGYSGPPRRGGNPLSKPQKPTKGFSPPKKGSAPSRSFNTPQRGGYGRRY